MPPEISKGNFYEKELKRMPINLEEALYHFENSEFMRNSFGDVMFEHLVKFYRNEIEKYDKNITKWELNRYFDLI
jgi:glutamine synthetase